MPLIVMADYVSRPVAAPERDSNPSGKRLAWIELCAREPRLIDLFNAVNNTVAGAAFCANAAWYRRGGFKSQLSQIIGFASGNPDAALRTPAAYDVTYQRLYALLPDCRHESICGPYR